MLFHPTYHRHNAVVGPCAHCFMNNRWKIIVSEFEFEFEFETNCCHSDVLSACSNSCQTWMLCTCHLRVYMHCEALSNVLHLLPMLTRTTAIAKLDIFMEESQQSVWGYAIFRQRCCSLPSTDGAWEEGMHLNKTWQNVQPAGGNR